MLVFSTYLFTLLLLTCWCVGKYKIRFWSLLSINAVFFWTTQCCLRQFPLPVLNRGNIWPLEFEKQSHDLENFEHIIYTWISINKFSCCRKKYIDSYINLLHCFHFSYKYTVSQLHNGADARICCCLIHFTAKNQMNAYGCIKHIVICIWSRNKLNPNN